MRAHQGVCWSALSCRGSVRPLRGARRPASERPRSPAAQVRPRPRASSVEGRFVRCAGRGVSPRSDRVRRPRRSGHGLVHPVSRVGSSVARGAASRPGVTAFAGRAGQATASCIQCRGSVRPLRGARRLAPERPRSPAAQVRPRPRASSVEGRFARCAGRGVSPRSDRVRRPRRSGHGLVHTLDDAVHLRVGQRVVEGQAKQP